MAQHKKKYLDPEKLKQIGSLEIVARLVVEGLRIGSHKSPARGISSVFSAYRQYVAGDETMHIDWKNYPTPMICTILDLRFLKSIKRHF